MARIAAPVQSSGRRMSLMSGIAFLAIAALSQLSAQADSSSSNRVTLPSGTVIPVVLNTELSSDQSSSGDTFTANVDTSKDAYNSILNGATVQGTVRRATAKNGSDPGVLDLTFTNLQLADGRSVPFNGSLTSLNAKDLNVSDSGLLQAKSTRKNNALTYAGIGAGAGALVSLIGGGKLKIEDVLLGGLAGYGVSTIIKGQQEVHDVDLKPGTPMGVLVRNQVQFTRTASNTPMYHQSYRSSGIKYYRFNGQTWAKDLSTGERYPVSSSAAPVRSSTKRHYTYQGHSYVMDTETGERTQID